MVVPLCLASLWLAYKFVPASAPGGVEPNRQGEALDWRGLLLGTVGTLCLLNGLVSLHGGSMAEARLCSPSPWCVWPRSSPGNADSSNAAANL